MAKNKEKKNAAKNEEIEMNAAVDEKEQETCDQTSNEAEEVVTFTKEEFDKAREQIETMKKQIDESKKAVDEAVLDAQRIQAEFANFRKRNQSVRAESIDDGVRDTIKVLLPVLDNFDRALSQSDGSPFAKGMEQIQKQLVACLNKCGMEEVEAEGMFDPNLHEAVMQDDETEAESGTITAVLQKGYRVKGKIVRHTMVKVRS